MDVVLGGKEYACIDVNFTGIYAGFLSSSSAATEHKVLIVRFIS